MNPYKQLRALLAPPLLDVGEVTAATTETATVSLLTGGTLTVRGVASVGDVVYIRDGVIEGPAPTLSGSEIEI